MNMSPLLVIVIVIMIVLWLYSIVVVGSRSDRH